MCEHADRVSKRLHERKILTQSDISSETANEPDRADEDEEVDDGNKDAMTVVVVRVDDLEGRDGSESRELLNEREGGRDHSLRSDDRGENGKDPGDPPVSGSRPSRDRLEEDVLDDRLGVGDQSGTLSEVGEEETGVDEAGEGEADRLLAELSEAAQRERDVRVSLES